MLECRVTLSKFEKTFPRRTSFMAADRKALMEFHVRKGVREEHNLEGSLFSLTGNVILTDVRQVRTLAQRMNEGIDPVKNPEQVVQAGQLNAMGLIDEILHYVVALYREQVQPDIFETTFNRFEKKFGETKTEALLEKFCSQFPPKDVYSGKLGIPEYLESSDNGESCRSLTLEELLLLTITNLNPALRRFSFLFDDTDLAKETVYPAAIDELKTYLGELPAFGPDGKNLWDILRAPALASPNSLMGQLDFMRKHWGLLLGKYMGRLLTGLDIIKEEEKPSFFGPGPSQVLDFSSFENEYERFTPDQDWMPRTVLMAKCTLVWLFQLSRKYGRELTRLDQIPDEELDELAHRGFTGLWLIGLWERSKASRTIKQWTGNPEAAASAYSLYDYDIASELGGWGALADLRERCIRRGIRLGSDMVPNHTGIDSRWVVEHPDRFLQLSYPPFPTYNYSCENLSGRDDITVQIEDHYFSRNDAAVVFKRINNHTGEVRYIYHGNDGTSMPWNDTAQIDFLNPEAREAVMRTIVTVCQQFPIVRFDAAMTLAKRHIQRLWYPAPGQGGDIASRAEHAISTEEFNRHIPEEFWREVVDRCAVEAPHTLLLAEAFWMMEGYFVRTLGMHRVYNSAFMNMLKNEENEKYRATIKNTLEFDPEILKRFVNFMNNPDEDTAVAQFGKGDKYFGICTLLVTMPGLPMFGHGQIEGFEEKYGMEYRRSYRDEMPDGYLVDRHEREIFPLMKKRRIFSGSENFCLYNFHNDDGKVNENVFAYSNRAGNERALVFYNNSYSRASGWIHRGAVAIPQKDGRHKQDALYEAYGLHSEDRFFTVFLEQRSGLWYIRSSRDIAERGFFASLNGYEAQVFLDIQEKEDAIGAAPGSWEGRWARLNHELNGRGVKDLEEAILEIYFADIYIPFREILSPERAEDLKRLFSETEVQSSSQKTKATIDKFIESFRKPVNTFATAVTKHAVTGHVDEGAGKCLEEQPDRNGKDTSAAVKNWFLYLGNLLSLIEKPAAKDSGTFLLKLREEIQKQPALALLALGYNTLTLLQLAAPGSHKGENTAAALAHKWQLDRILCECCESSDLPHDQTHRGADIAMALLVRHEAIISRKADILKTDALTEANAAADATAIAANLILENYTSEDFIKILGVNRFDEVTWFNKEAFEQALLLVPFFLSLDGEQNEGKQKRIKVIAAVTETFHKAGEGVSYRLDDLLERLSGGELRLCQTPADLSGAPPENE